MEKKSHSRYFRNNLLRWNEEQNTRQLPWKSEKNPYYIWLSEVILQQTRAEQGLPYYLLFQKNYPTVFDLAKAPIDKVLRDWQGLGYYSRARNLHHTAKIIATEHGGKFPDTYDKLIKLKGIGDYTASAIASFAFGRQNAVVDGNVIRVLSRFFGIETAFDTTQGKSEFRKLATETLGDADSASYNQAIMDFGAAVCTPKNPGCDNCPLQKKCFAFEKELIADLPHKSKKLKVKERYFYYLLPANSKFIFIQQRSSKDIWHSLWEFPVIELDFKAEANDFEKIEKELSLPHSTVVSVSAPFSQRLTHQKINSLFVKVKNLSAFSRFRNCRKVRVEQLADYAFPKTIISYIGKNVIN